MVTRNEPTKGVLHNNGDRDRCYFLLIAVCDVRSMALVCDHVDLLLTELLMEQKFYDDDDVLAVERAEDGPSCR